MFESELRNVSMTVWWNLALLTIGGVLFSLGMNAIAVPHGFISGGIFGTGIYIYYATGVLSPAMWYLLLNLPIFVLGWLFVSRRFFLYSLYGTAVTTIAAQFITWQAHIANPLLAAVAAGTVCGAGLGIVLRSLGSEGGMTIIAIILHQRWGMRVGQVSFLYNFLLFMVGLATLDVDVVLYSVILVYTYSQVMDYVHSLFNQRKMVFIISECSECIAAEILQHLHRGATFLQGKGAFTGRDKQVLMTVVQNYQLKRLEETVFRHDPNAFMIVENTFNVLGTGFSSRKVY